MKGTFRTEKTLSFFFRIIFSKGTDLGFFTFIQAFIRHPVYISCQFATFYRQCYQCYVTRFQPRTRDNIPIRNQRNERCTQRLLSLCIAEMIPACCTVVLRTASFLLYIHPFLSRTKLLLYQLHFQSTRS